MNRFRAAGTGVLASTPRLRLRRWLTQWTINHELALLVLAALVPFAALGAYWALADYHSKQNRTRARAPQLAHEASAEVDQQVADPITRCNSTHHVFVVATKLWDEVVDQGWASLKRNRR